MKFYMPDPPTGGGTSKTPPPPASKPAPVVGPPPPPPAQGGSMPPMFNVGQTIKANENPYAALEQTVLNRRQINLDDMHLSNREYASRKAEVNRLSTVEAEYRKKVDPLIKNLAANYLSDKDIAMSYSRQAKDGLPTANRHKLIMEARKLAEQVGGGDYVHNLISAALIGQVEAKLAAPRIQKDVDAALGGKKFTTLTKGADGKYTSMIPEIAKAVDEQTIAGFENSKKAIRAATVQKLRMEVNGLRKSFFEPNVEALKQEYAPKLDEMAKGIVSKYENQILQAVNAKRSELTTAVQSGAMNVVDANAELQRFHQQQYAAVTQERIQKEAKDLFDQQYGKEYQQKWSKIHDNYLLQAASIEKKYRSFEKSEVEREAKKYEAIRTRAYEMVGEDEKREIEELNEAYKIAFGVEEERRKASLGIAKANFLVSRNANPLNIPAFVDMSDLYDNFKANTGKMVANWGDYLDSIGLGGKLADELKGVGLDVFETNKTYHEPLTWSNALDPQQLGGNVFAQMAYSAPSIVAGVATGGAGLAPTLISGTVGWGTNLMMMVGDTYRQALESGMTEAQAQQASKNMAALEMLYLPQSLLQAKWLFGSKGGGGRVMSLLTKKPVEAVTSTVGEFVQEASESAGQKTFLDQTGKTTFGSAFFSKEAQQEGLMAGYSNLLMGLMTGGFLGGGKSRSAAPAAQFQAMHNMTQRTGNQMTPMMMVDRMWFEGDLTEAEASEARAMISKGIQFTSEAEAAGMTPAQAKLFASLTLEFEKRKAEADGVNNPMLKEAAIAEANAIQEEAKAVANGTVAPVEIVVDDNPIVMTAPAVEQAMQSNPELAQAVANGGVEVNANAEVAAKLRNFAASLTEQKSTKPAVFAPSRGGQTVIGVSAPAQVETTRPSVVMPQNVNRPTIVVGVAPREAAAAAPEKRGASVVLPSSNAPMQTIGVGVPQSQGNTAITNKTESNGEIQRQGEGQGQNMLTTPEEAASVQPAEQPTTSVPQAGEEVTPATIDEQIFEKERELEAEGYDAEEIASHPDIVALKKQLPKADGKRLMYRGNADLSISTTVNGVDVTIDKIDGKWFAQSKDGRIEIEGSSKADVMNQLETIANENDSDAMVGEATAAQQEVEQFEPITTKGLRHNKFTRDEAADYDEDEKEGSNGRTYTYLSRVAVEVENIDGDVIGRLAKLTDEDGIVNWQAEDEMGDEIGKEPFDTKAEAMQALVDKWNKDKKKEFDKAQKAKAKKAEKEAAKKAKSKPAPAPAQEQPAPVVQAPVEEPAAAPAPSPATTSLADMGEVERKAEGKKFISSLDGFFAQILPKIQDKTKSLTGKYNRAIELRRAEAITSEQFAEATDAIKKAARVHGVKIIDTASSEDEYMQGVRKEIEERKAGGAKSKTKQVTEAAKGAAKKIREHAKGVGKSQLNDAILGIPIAAYQAALNLTATMIEAGATVAEAVEAAVNYLSAELKGEKFSDKEIRRAYVAALDKLGIRMDEAEVDVKKNIDSKYDSQYVNKDGKVVTRRKIDRVMLTMKELAQKSFTQGKIAVDAIKDLQALLIANAESYGLTKFAVSTIKKMNDIISSFDADYDAETVFDLMERMDDVMLYEANRQKVQSVNKKLKDLQKLVKKSQLLKVTYERKLADVLERAVSPFKILKFSPDPDIALDEYAATIDALLEGFGKNQGVRGFSKQDIENFTAALETTADQIAEAELQANREKYNRLVEAGLRGLKSGITGVSFDQWMDAKRLSSDAVAEANANERLSRSDKELVAQFEMLKIAMGMLKSRVGNGDFSFDKHIESMAREIASIDANQLIAPMSAAADRDARMKANAESANKLAQLNDIINNILFDGDVTGAAMFVDQNLTIINDVKELTSLGAKIRAIRRTGLKNVTNLFDAMFFNKDAADRVRLSMYQRFAHKMIHVKNLFYGSKEAGIKGVAGEFKEILDKHLDKQNGINDLSRYRIGVVNFIMQYARDNYGKSAAENFNEAVARIKEVEIDGMKKHAENQGKAKRKKMRKFNEMAKMTEQAFKELGLDVADPASVFLDSNGSIDALMAKLTDGERELNEFMLKKLNDQEYVSGLKNVASSVLGMDFEIVDNYFPMFVNNFTGQEKQEGLDVGAMTRSMNGMQRVFVKPSDRNKKRNVLASNDKYYSMDAFSGFLSAYYEGLAQIHAGREAKKMQYLMNDKKFKEFLGGAFNRGLGMVKGGDAQENVRIMTKKLQEVFNDHMKAVGIYKNYESFAVNLMREAGNTMMSVYLKHPAQFWAQYVPQMFAAMRQIGGNEVFTALKTQVMAKTGTQEQREAYEKFLSHFSVAHRAAMGIVDDMSSQIDTNKVREFVFTGREKISDILGGFALEYSDQAIANSTIVASYIKSLINQGVISDASEFDVEMMAEHAENPNMLALTRAERETAEINNSSLKEERATRVKDKRDWDEEDASFLDTASRLITYGFLLKSFGMNSFNQLHNAIRISRSVDATAEERREARSEAWAAVVQLVAFNAIKSFVNAPLYSAAGVLAFSALTGAQPDGESEDEKKQRMASASYRFMMNIMSDAALGGMDALTESAIKAGSGFLIDKAVKAAAEHTNEKGQADPIMLPFLYGDILMDFGADVAKPDTKMNAWTTKYGNKTFLGSFEPVYEFGEIAYEGLSGGTIPDGLTDEGENALRITRAMRVLTSLFGKSSLLDRLDVQIQKQIKNSPAYNAASLRKKLKGGGGSGRSPFGGGGFGGAFGGKGL